MALGDINLADPKTTYYVQLQKLVSTTPEHYLLGDVFGRNALDYARDHGNQLTVDYLLSKPDWKKYLWDQSMSTNR